jgi:hypothetical protein
VIKTSPFTYNVTQEESHGRRDLNVTITIKNPCNGQDLHNDRRKFHQGKYFGLKFLYVLLKVEPISSYINNDKLFKYLCIINGRPFHFGHVDFVMTIIVVWYESDVAFFSPYEMGSNMIANLTWPNERQILNG